MSDSLRPVDSSPPSSSVHGILQARKLEWISISFSRGSSQPRDRTQVSHIAGRHFNLCTTREAHNKLWKILKDMGIPDHLTCLLRNLYAGQEATARPRRETMTGSKLGKEYVKPVYCHAAYLTSMQSTSRETLGWKKHKLESRLPGQISITSEMQMTTPPLWQKVKRK